MDTGPHNGSEGEAHDRDETYTPQEAARVLGLSDHRIRQMLDAGVLEGSKRGGRWWVLRRSVNQELMLRGSPRDRGRRAREWPNKAGVEAAELHDRLEALQREIGRLEGNLEVRRQLSEVAESTLRESLERERQRADEAAEEARRLREQLEETRRPWWQRMFG